MDLNASAMAAFGFSSTSNCDTGISLLNFGIIPSTTADVYFLMSLIEVTLLCIQYFINTRKRLKTTAITTDTTRIMFFFGKIGEEGVSASSSTMFPDTKPAFEIEYSAF